MSRQSQPDEKDTYRYGNHAQLEAAIKAVDKFQRTQPVHGQIVPAQLAHFAAEGLLG